MRNWSMMALLLVSASFSTPAVIYDRYPGDLSLALGIQAWQHPVATGFLEMVSFIGKGWPMVGFTSGAALCFYLVRRWREGCTFVGALAIMGLNPLFKLLIDRARPAPDLVYTFDSFGGLGYPSGHAFQSIVFFGLLFFLASIGIRNRWLRYLAQMFLAFLILSIGVSRVYLGAHWPSDVLGGYLLGGFFLALLIRGYQVSSCPQRSYSRDFS